MKAKIVSVAKKTELEKGKEMGGLRSGFGRPDMCDLLFLEPDPSGPMHTFRSNLMPLLVRSETTHLLHEVRARTLLIRAPAVPISRKTENKCFAPDRVNHVCDHLHDVKGLRDASYRLGLEAKLGSVLRETRSPDPPIVGSAFACALETFKIASLCLSPACSAKIYVCPALRCATECS